ncbi:MAG: alpha/beta fold hydrolase [Spirochaetota bacterium]
MRRYLFWVIAASFLGLWGHFVWLRTGKPAMSDEVRARFGKRSIQLSAGKTAFDYAEGEGETVVLVHGFSIPSVVWDNTYKALVRHGIPVLRYDLYGRGFSDRPGVRYDADLFVRQLKELTDEIVGGGKFVICGLSMGGAIAVHFADRYPERISRLVLIDPAGYPMTTPVTAKLVQLPGIGDYAGRLMARRAMQKGLAENFARNVPATIEASALVQTEYAGYADAIVSTLRHMNMGKMQDIYERVGKKKLPTLLIWGKKDRVIPFSNAELVRKVMPHAQFLPLENAGHIPTSDESEKTHRAILRFLGTEPIEL